MNLKYRLHETIHYFLRSFILASFALFIVYLVRTDNLDLYIAARMQWLVKCTALGMYVVAAHQLYRTLQALSGNRSHARDCCDDHTHDMPSSWRTGLLLYGWFVLPLALALLIPNGLLGSAMAAAKGVQFQAGQIVMPESPSDPFLRSFAKYGQELSKQDPIRVQDDRFIETLTALDLYKQAFIGRTVQIQGFVYRERGMNNRQFSVTRFAMSCCSADAYPYGILVKDDNAYSIEENEWVSVTGTLSLASYNGIEAIQLVANDIRYIQPPDNPYVSPDVYFELE
ncbi:TIGR03943 family putative permease subunit [Cohnella panacarvi]|uniref:TIGR03943 family putative permease subunit n=1 Tax=Cohnella panacarvi TaxID=400776 RepID=UPI00047E4008|nr:TIGR03943 family protein [Cohnella panacarvi]